MQFYYDDKTDSLSIKLMKLVSVESEEVAQDIILDYSVSGQVVGMDIQHASRHVDLSGFELGGFRPSVEFQPSV